MSTLKVWKGTALNTTKVPIKDGQLLFETDTKKIWLDNGTTRLQISGQDTVKTMTASEFEALTSAQKILLYNEGVRVIAVDGELDPNNMSDMQRFADFNNPVGTIREFNISTNPATLFGVGTWESYMPGRVLIGAGTANFGSAFEAGQTGGEENHTLTIDEIPSHDHALYIYKAKGSSGGSSISTQANWWDEVSGYGRVGSQGGSQSHNNMQPYAVVYRWLRVA